MLFASALVALHIAAFALGAIDDTLSDSIIPLVQCGLGFAGLLVPGVRRALLDTLVRYWPAALAYVALVFLAMHQAGLLQGSPAADLRVARADVWRLIGFGFGALGIAGAALAAGRRNAQNALLVGAIVLGVLAIAQNLQAGRTLFPAPRETAVVFALFAALGAFAIADALGQRAARTGERRQTRAERLFVPVAGFGSALIGLALTGSLDIAAAFGIGLAALAGTLALRERRRGMGVVALVTLASVSALAGALLLFLIHRAGDMPPAIDMNAMSGDLGLRAGLAALAWLALLARLGMSLDRRRRPSRGLALALGGCAVMLLAGSAGAAPAAFATLALLIGMAAAHADYLAPVNPELRNSGQS